MSKDFDSRPGWTRCDLYDFISGNGKLNQACPTKKRGRRPGPTESTIEFRAALAPTIREQKPCTIRQAFYQAVWRNLVDKSEKGYGKVQRELLAMRRSGQIPYSWITDLRRQPYGRENYGNPHEFINDIASLYRRDYWRNSAVNVEFWCEKETLISAMSPVIVNQWGLDYYAGGGFTSETALFVAGSAIKNLGKPTHVYILSDFDPSGESIVEHIAHGSKKSDGGLSRFTGGVSVFVHQLALTEEQVQKWNLPTRKANKGKPKSEWTKQVREFIAKHGDAAAELDAIPPNTLRDLIDEAITRHADVREIERLKAVEHEEREQFSSWLEISRKAAS